MKFQPLKKLVYLFFETTFLYSYNTLDNCKTNLYIPRVYRYFLYFLPRLLKLTVTKIKIKSRCERHFS